MLLVPTRLAQSPIHGFGVFAAAPIAKGTPVWRFERGLDMEFDPGIVETLPEHVRTFFSHYGYLDRNVKRIILCFDDARFVNHSDDAECRDRLRAGRLRPRRRAARHRGGRGADDGLCGI